MGYRSVVSVTTPATTFNLTTLLRVKAALDINDATPQQDEWLRRAIKTCSLAVARECNRVLVRQSYSEVFYPTGCGWGWSDTIQLSRWPVIEITSIGSLVDGTDFSVVPDTGQLIRLTGGTQIAWSTPSPPMTVEYDAGYDPIPEDLQDIVHGLIQGQWLAFTSDGTSGQLRSEEIPGVASYTYSTLATAAGSNFAAAAKDAVNAYRVPAFC